MPELGKIQPTQRIIPAREDQHVHEKKKQEEHRKKNRNAKRDEHSHKHEGKVDEYI